MICDLFFCYCGFCSFVYAFNCVLWVDLSFACEGWMCLFWQSLEKGSPVEIGVIFLLGIVYMLLKLCCILISGYCWSHKFFLDFSSFFFFVPNPNWPNMGSSQNFVESVWCAEEVMFWFFCDDILVVSLCVFIFLCQHGKQSKFWSLDFFFPCSPIYAFIKG